MSIDLAALQRARESRRSTSKSQTAPTIREVRNLIEQEQSIPEDQTKLKIAGTSFEDYEAYRKKWKEELTQSLKTLFENSRKKAEETKKKELEQPWRLKTSVDPEIKRRKKKTKSSKQQEANFEVIDKVYDDVKTTSTNPQILAYRSGVSVDDARNFLAANEYNQTQAPKNSVMPNKKLFMGRAGWPTLNAYALDLLDMQKYDQGNLNDKQRYIMTALDMNTRYCYAVSVKKKSAEACKEALVLMMEKMNKDAERKDFSHMKLRTFVIDDGKEWEGSFKSHCKKNNIRLWKLEGYAHERLNRLNRFHRTYRNLLGQVFSITDSNEWQKYLDDITDNYNSRPHMGLGRYHTAETPFKKHVEGLTENKKKKKNQYVNLSPAEITTTQAVAVIADDNEHRKKVRERVDGWMKYHDIKLGETKVRILMERTKVQSDAFYKKSMSPIWSSDLYILEDRVEPDKDEDGKDLPSSGNMFIVRRYAVGKDGGRLKTPKKESGIPALWPVYSLQVVKTEPRTNKNKGKGRKISKHTPTGKKDDLVELENILEEEKQAIVDAYVNPITDDEVGQAKRDVGPTTRQSLKRAKEQEKKTTSKKQKKKEQTPVSTRVLRSRNKT